MALIACNKCGQQISAGVRTCPQCGASQPLSVMVKLGILGLIAISLASAAYAIAHNRRATSGIGSNIAIDDNLEADAEMKVMAERYVKRALQAPATAKFAPAGEWEVKQIDKSSSRMHAWVDSDNSSETTLRAHFTIAIRLNKASASLLYLQFDDDEKPMYGVKPLTDDEKKLELQKK
jgi:hypothetical protein